MRGWSAQNALEPRADVAVGFIRLPEDRAASDRVSALTGIAHRSPQLILFQNAHARSSTWTSSRSFPTSSCRCCASSFPSRWDRRSATRRWSRSSRIELCCRSSCDGELPEERFQWGYLDRLAKEALWRDDETFALLNSLFENEWGRDVRAARLVAVEFQGQLAGRLEPLAGAGRAAARAAGRAVLAAVFRIKALPR